MDKLADYLSSYSTSLEFRNLPAEVVHQVKRHLIDTLGCALGGFVSEPAKIARRIASAVPCQRAATILGSGQKTTPELAAFANGIMIRYLDFNDGYSGHPSDNFASILACADALHADGKRVIVAATLAYEVFCRFEDALNLREKGFDHVVNGCLASTLGASKVWGLSKEQMAQAINLAVTPNIALVQTRYGDVSMWKNCAAANASRNAVFATRLAAEGMTGPAPIFEGRGGFFKAVSGHFEMETFGGSRQPYKIMEANIKPFPAGLHSQTAIEAALRIRPWLVNVDEIEEITIKTYERAFRVMAGDPQKWHPKTQETADHSLPYVVALAILYGGVNPDYYSPEYLDHPQLMGLMQKVKVTVSEDCNKGFPEGMPNIVELTTKSGQRISERVDHFQGHHKNRMTDEEIEKKFLSLTGRLLTSSQIRSMIEALWNLENLEDISQLMEMFVV